MVEAANRQRKSVNTIVPGFVFQRAKILTWPKIEKEAFLSELNIKIVVNFWPKIDPDFGEMNIWYWHMPTRRSIGMTDPSIIGAATHLANIIHKHETPALILCEAGKTRSVFFSALLCKHLLNLEYTDALCHIETAAPKHKMKKFMIEWLKTQ